MSRNICPSCGSHSALGEIHCFKCGHLTNLKSVDIKSKITTDNIKLPRDLINKPQLFSIAALKWLYKYQIYDDLICKHNFGYCPESDSVFIPAIDKHDVVRWYQLRALQESAYAKYITYGKSSNYLIHYNNHDSDVVVIVEDHMSAIKLSKYFNVVALSGTSLSHGRMCRILLKYTDIILWLDADKPGQDAANKIILKMQDTIQVVNRRNYFIGEPTKLNIYKINELAFIKDPKWYTYSQIQLIIKETLND